MNNYNSKSDEVNDSGSPGEFRIEHDSMGEIRVPASACWGAQTQRAIDNFPISKRPIEPSLVVALAMIKKAAAIANEALGAIDSDVAESIRSAAEGVIDGEHFKEFPVDVFQTGSGTSSNMNMNEVLAFLATNKLGKEVKPNDHVNASQSSNDVFPSAIHIACAISVTNDLIPALKLLALSLSKKEDQFKDVVKSGRTHLMDATPVTLGQEFGGYSQQVLNGVDRLRAVLERVVELPLGGTAVGTGLNAPKEFAKTVIEEISRETKIPFFEARNHFEAQGARDSLVEASGVLRTIGVSLYKIANDLRWMSSGPRCGLGEIHLPDLQPGSSIMPGKVNPVVPEAVCQVVAQVIGNDVAVGFGGSQGNLELNVMLPVIGRNLLESVTLLANVSRALASKCIDGIEADVEKCLNYALSSPSIGTSLNPYIGYEEAAKVIKQSLKEGRDLKSIVVENGLLTQEEADKALDVLAMTKGGIIK